MTHPSKRKGDQFERDVVAYLRDHGHPYAERAYGAGRQDDVGDIDGIVGWCIECKNHRSLDLAAWVDEAERERNNGRRPRAAVIAKRRGKPVERSYVLLDLATFVALLAEEDY